MASMAASLSARPCMAVGEGLAGLALIRLEAGNRLSFLHLQEVVEGLHHAGRKALGQLGNDVFLAGPLLLLADQS